VHVLDLAPLDGSDPEANWTVIERELAEHDPRLAGLPRILALSKADLVAGDAASRAVADWSARLGAGVPVIATSSATGQGVRELQQALLERVPTAPEIPEVAGEDEMAEYRVFRPAVTRSFDVERTGDGGWRVTGDAVERLVARYDLEEEEALAHVEHRLRRMGVIDACRPPGSSPATDVEIAGNRVRARSGVLMPTLVVKLGSSVVAEDNGELRCRSSPGCARRSPSCTRRGGRRGRHLGCDRLRGSRLLGLPSRPTAIEALQAASAVGQGRLYRTYDEFLRERGLSSAQVLLTFFDMSAADALRHARRTLRQLLSWRFVPVINENDTTTTDEISFGDNDFLAAQVAVLVGRPPARALTQHRRLFKPRTPRIDPGARSSPTLGDPVELEALSIGSATSPLGSGGMRSKVMAAEMATRPASRPVIGNASHRRPAARLGRTSRPARASRARGAAFELQASGSSTPSRRGRVSWVGGAGARCATAAPRCCPSGSSTSQGAFDAGTRSTCARRDGGDVGKGITNYSADELRRVKGMKSGDVREVLPRATEEAVHRDYFVLA
jgi:glutamate 5-kinase